MTHTTFAPTIPFILPASGRRGCLFLFLLGFFLLLAFPCRAVPPQQFLLGTPSASVKDGMITLALSVTVDNEDGLRDMLKNGAVLELGVAVSLERRRSWWANAEVTGKEFVSVIRHDPLNRDFLLTYPTPDGERELRDRNLVRLLYASWRKLSLPVAALDQFKDVAADDEYIITFTVRLQHTEVPPWLEKGTVFWSSDVVPKENRTLPLSLPARGGE